MNSSNIKFRTFFWRVAASHMISYFIMGFIALHLLDYKNLFENPPFSYLMKPISSPWIALGPLLQVFRGLVFSLALWLFKDVFLDRKYGWLKLFGILIGLSLLSTVGPTPGSIEGLIYTQIPIKQQLIGYFEVVPQLLIFSIMVFYWCKFPKQLYNVLSIVIVVIICLMSVAGFLSAF